MAQTKQKPRKRSASNYRLMESEPDGQFLLKLVLVTILASLWIKLSTPMEWNGVFFSAIPIGVFAGLILVHVFEHFQTDRKIWFATLIVVGIMSYFLPAGIVV